ncbi:MAG: ATP-binding protein [Actinomycetota bacterium]|nr:ATP-binding protein [Actinomycetota bacterium]
MRPERHLRRLSIALVVLLVLSGIALVASAFGWRIPAIVFAALAAASAAFALAAALARPRAPRAAAQPRLRIDTVLESFPSPALLVSEDGAILEINLLACKLVPGMEREPSDFLGKPLDEAFLPPYFGNWSPLLKEVRGGRGPLDRRGEQYFLKGKTGFCEVWTSLLEGGPGEHNRFLVMIKDITLEATEHVALLEASEREAGVFEGVPVKIAVLDRNFRLARCNRLMMQWVHDTCNLEEGALIGTPALDIMPKEFRADWKRILRRVLVEGRSFEQPRVHQTVAGIDYFHRVRIHPLTDESGNVREDLLLYEDVTEYVRLERRLAETTDYLNLLIESLNDGFYAMDAEGGFTFCNQAFLDMLGISDSAELFRRNAIDIVMPEERRKIERMLERHERGEKVFFETLLRCRGDIPLPVQMSSAPLFRAGKFSGIVGIAHNLSERRRLEEMVERSHQDLEKAYEELSVLDRMKSDFIAIASHELRTPLSIIKGYADAFQFGELGELSEFQMDKVKIMNARADQMTKIINDLLDVTRLEEGRLVGERWPAPVDGLVTNAVSEYKGRAAQCGQELLFSVENNLPPVSVDVWRVHQVMENLIGNAIKFTPEGGTIEVVARSSGDPDMVEIEVRDTGPGIPLQEQGKLFTMFYQAETDSARSVGGLGLGLVISKGIIEGHGGRIWVESEAGRGSSFKFTIPISRGE